MCKKINTIYWNHTQLQIQFCIISCTCCSCWDSVYRLISRRGSVDIVHPTLCQKRLKYSDRAVQILYSNITVSQSEHCYNYSTKMCCNISEFQYSYSGTYFFGEHASTSLSISHPLHTHTSAPHQIHFFVEEKLPHSNSWLQACFSYMQSKMWCKCLWQYL